MNDSQPSPELEAAFADLVSVSSRLLQRGKPPRAAAVKAALLLHSEPPFDESRLGFPRFGAFLKAAEAAGHVDLRSARVGPDVDVVPRGASEPESVPSSDRMRSDVWDAFTRWDRGFVRCWDRKTSRAHRLKQTPDATEPSAVTELRRMREQDPGRFVRIDHVPVHVVKAWAEEFAVKQDPQVSQELRRSLEHELPIREFTATVRRSSLVPEWHGFHLEQVRQVVSKWATANDVTVDLSAEPQPLDSGPTSSRRLSGTRQRPGQGNPEEQLRERMHAWIDEMTMPELLSISVPVRLVVAEA